MNISIANAIAIKTATHTIAVLWHDATLIADKLANPHHTPTGGIHTTRTTPPEPINLHATSVLDDIHQWLIIAATACERDYTRNLSTPPVQLADYVSGHATVLAHASDALQWVTDAVSASMSIRLICGETTRDPTRWRGALVDWDPTQIANTLTDLTGRRVKANTISQLKHRGKIEIINGRVILGEIATALGIKD